MGKKKKSDEIVDVIASGYEWTCPQCEHLNLEIEVKEEVECTECKTKFDTNPPAHAYPH